MIVGRERCNNRSARNYDFQHRSLLGDRRTLGCDPRRRLPEPALLRVVASRDGGFVVAWESDGQDGSGYGIYAQRFTSAGARIGAEVRVNTTTVKDQRWPAIAALRSDFLDIGADRLRVLTPA